MGCRRGRTGDRGPSGTVVFLQLYDLGVSREPKPHPCRGTHDIVSARGGHARHQSRYRLKITFAGRSFHRDERGHTSSRCRNATAQIARGGGFGARARGGSCCSTRCLCRLEAKTDCRARRFHLCRSPAASRSHFARRLRAFIRCSSICVAKWDVVAFYSCWPCKQTATSYYSTVCHYSIGGNTQCRTRGSRKPAYSATAARSRGHKLHHSRVGSRVRPPSQGLRAAAHRAQHLCAAP